MGALEAVHVSADLGLWVLLPVSGDRSVSKEEEGRKKSQGSPNPKLLGKEEDLRGGERPLERNGMGL